MAGYPPAVAVAVTALEVVEVAADPQNLKPQMHSRMKGNLAR